MAVEIFIHKMSEHMETARIIRWLVKEGERVEQYQILMEVETDKVTADLESPAAGVLKGIRPGAVDGAVVNVGETIAFIAEAGEAVASLPPLGGATTESAAGGNGAEPAVAAPAPAPAEGGPVRATPVARRVAKELGVDLSRVKGSGPNGMVREEDVRQYSARPAAPVPASAALAAPSAALASAAAAPAAASELVELTAAQRLTGQRILQSVQTQPQFSLTLQADCTQLLWLVEALAERAVAETGAKLTLTTLLVKIVAAALKNHPRLNAAYEDGRVRLYRAAHIGVAVGTANGLVVPVVRDAGGKTLYQVGSEIRRYQEQGKAMRFNPADLEGGTFTLSNLGMTGVGQFNAILNPPQSAILAVGKIVKTPVALDDGSIAVRPLLSLTVTVDHRVVDGLQGAQFLAELKERVEKPYFLL